MVASSKRDIKEGKAYFKHFPGNSLRMQDTVMYDMGSVFDTIIAMAKVVKLSLGDTKSIAPELKGKNLQETCKNIWEWSYNHFQYNLDNPGVEQLRTPARSWENRGWKAGKGEGIDCDDFSILVSSILTNLKIPHSFRMAKYGGKDYFQHIYVVVPKKTGANMDFGGDYWTIDPVVDRNNKEVKFSDKHDKDMMPIMMLSGLQGVQSNNVSGTNKQLAGFLTGKERKMTFGNEFAGLGDFRGLGNVHVTPEMVGQDFLFRAKKHIINTLKQVKETPFVFKDARSFIIRYEWLLSNFDDPKTRDEALDHIARLENLEEASGLAGYSSGLGSWFGDRIRAVTGAVSQAANWVGEKTVQATSAVKQAAQWTGGAVKQAAQWTGENLKVAAKGMVDMAKDTGNVILKYNPLSVAIRTGLRLAFSINFKKLSERLGWGYMPEEEAIAKGLDRNEFRKLKDKLDSVITTYSKHLQGDENKLKEVILKKWAEKTNNGTSLSGLSGLGIEPVTATTGIVAASGVIAKILVLLKDVAFPLLFNKFTGPKTPESAENYPDPPTQAELQEEMMNYDQNPSAYNPENITQAGTGISTATVGMAAAAVLFTVVAIKKSKEKQDGKRK